MFLLLLGCNLMPVPIPKYQTYYYKVPWVPVFTVSLPVRTQVRKFGDTVTLNVRVTSQQTNKKIYKRTVRIRYHRF
jgi:hypothetical protein